MAEKFILVKEGRVENSVMADSFEQAQEYFGSDVLVLQETEETGIAHDYAIWDGTRFIESEVPRPYRPEIIEQMKKFPAEQISEQPTE